MSSIGVETGSRLHFGPLASGTGSGRRFGGIGLMVREPALRVRVERCAGGLVVECRPASAVGQGGEARDVVDATSEYVERVARFWATYSERCPSAAKSTTERRAATESGWRVILDDPPPFHVGLGTGTQLALALGRAWSEAAGETGLPATELARRTGRGLRSALGCHGFDRGGFLVDGGKRDGEAVSPLATRVPFPEDWPIVLVRPAGKRGISGSQEVGSFAQLASMPSPLTDRLCRLVVMELLPALHTRHYPDFAAALWEYGQRVGDYFAPVQGGPFAIPEWRDLAPRLAETGCRAIAQTSWGPTVAVVCPHDEAAEAVRRHITRATGETSWIVTTTRVRNTAAVVRRPADEMFSSRNS